MWNLWNILISYELYFVGDDSLNISLGYKFTFFILLFKLFIFLSILVLDILYILFPPYLIFKLLLKYLIAININIIIKKNLNIYIIHILYIII